MNEITERLKIRESQFPGCELKSCERVDGTLRVIVEVDGCTRGWVYDPKNKMKQTVTSKSVQHWREALNLANAAINSFLYNEESEKRLEELRKRSVVPIDVYRQVKERVTSGKREPDGRGGETHHDWE